MSFMKSPKIINSVLLSLLYLHCGSLFLPLKNNQKNQFSVQYLKISMDFLIFFHIYSERWFEILS